MDTENKNLEQYVGRYFFWTDDWNWNYEGMYVKSADEENDELFVTRFFVTEDALWYDTDSFLFGDQDGYLEDIDEHEVSKEEYWEKVRQYTEAYYDMEEHSYDDTTSKKNN